MSDVVVTGLGAVSACGWGAPALAAGLAAGRSCAAPLTVFDPAGHRTRLAMQVPPPERAPGVRTRTESFAVAAAREAAASAGLVDGAAAGVFFASTTGGMLEAETFHAAVAARPRAAGGFARLASQQNDAPANAVVRALGARGPVATYASACAAGTMAIEAALDAVRAGEVDVAFAGGADGLCRLTHAGFNALRAVDERPCRPFRADRAGLNLGEGAGVLVLERRAHAEARGARALATLRGAGSSCDAHHMTAPDPAGAGAAAAMRGALADADAAAAEVAFVNAHGTGTPLNDAAEAAALRAVFGARAADLPVTASKAVFGHLLGASGALEAVATVVCLDRRAVHETPGDGPPDPDAPVRLVTAPFALGPGALALSVSFGFGGANAALLLEGAS